VKVGKAHKSSYNKYPNICSDIEVYRFGVTLQILVLRQIQTWIVSIWE